MTRIVIGVLIVVVLTAAPVVASSGPTLEEAEVFMTDAEESLLRVWVDAERAAWVQATYITDDTEIIAAQAQERAILLAVRLAKEATRFDGVEMPAELARKFEKLQLALTLPAPSDPDETAELTRLTTSMESVYGRGTYCPEGGECASLGDLSRIMAESRDPVALEEAWRGWRTVSPVMREAFGRYVELGNKGARELGYTDLGSMWRSKYDMDPDAFAAEVDRLWSQVRPFYESLHCYVRGRLAATYGEDAVPLDQPIPAHLLGNMWAQDWSNVYPLAAPVGGDSAIDVTARLAAAGLDERQMVEYGERFFTSLGFEPLPDTFWERSLFTKPADRDVVCHASAWDLDWAGDLRIKMCIEITEEDFTTIHHELGHNFYQRAYDDLPVLFRDSANDGFHEAVGDTIALSVTPEYLVEIGLLDEVPAATSDIGLLLKRAMEKIAFLPFGLLVDQWRWKVFSGDIEPDAYNASWWELRTRYQGVRPPMERTEADFDPGAKYHVPANVPYTRYFLAHILQFQFHRALCDAAGFEGPLHRCSVYGSAEAGERLAAMLEMGSSRPWPEALVALAGSGEMDATAIVDYFAPLAAWLDEQNEGMTCGW